MRKNEREVETIDSKENLIRLVTQYKNLVFSVCLKMTGDYFVAEDITQETFITAFRLGQEIKEDTEKAWLCRVATNKCIDWKREAARKSVSFPEEEMPEIADSSSNNPLNCFLCKETEQKLLDACKALKSPYDEIARLHFTQGLTAREISERTGTGLKTVQTQIYRAKEMLKQKIRKEDLLE